MLSLLSPVILLNDLLQLAVNQPFADFSDSSDSKKKEKFFSYVYKEPHSMLNSNH